MFFVMRKMSSILTYYTQIKAKMPTKKKLFEMGRTALENLLDDLVRVENEDAPPASILIPPRDDMRKKLQRHKSAMELGRERAQKKDKAQGQKAVRQQAERDARASRTRGSNASAPPAKRSKTAADSAKTAAKGGAGKK